MSVSVLPLELTPTEQVQVYHNAWAHPSNSKFERIVRFRSGKGFPRHLLRTLKHFRCKVCGICKGARTYRKSKLVKEKAKKSLPPCVSKSGSLPLSPSGLQDVNSTESDLDVMDTTSGAGLQDKDLSTEAHIDFAHGTKLGITRRNTTFCLSWVLQTSFGSLACPRAQLRNSC
eukprot:3292502-Rhodomonas_salina.3